ncbi:uncharacterized protein LOC117177421 [Belonocnema kinseyi]|uniref:uncharacterized protein LOC117177421 n=1 Tax=Belonocnema kinseyi TaxID=2817044 RepID=UPI00143D5141|nr:uncharacterized protein LOC117177421 [Belonocnema kinseyi]
MPPRLDVVDSMDVESPSRCLRFLHLLWKFCKCVFSHVSLVSLVVSYCVLGARAFVYLEADHEEEVKNSITYIRGNMTQTLWQMTLDSKVLMQENWTLDAMKNLKCFEKDLLTKMKKEGWDGSEDLKNVQWTFAGALFYSIIVITTIGYGHIAPKTRNGKVVTIFYAILGIPLMLLCLSNIGDIMASSFRFLYWKVCCYVCTRPPKKKRPRKNFSRAQSVRQSSRYPGNSRRAPSFRRSIRASQRSADSALGISLRTTRSLHSDNDYRYHLRRYDGIDQRRPGSYQPSAGANLHVDPRQSTISRYSDVPVSTPKMTRGAARLTTQSLDRRLLVNPRDNDRSPVFFNKYALDDVDDPVDVRPKWRTLPSDRANSEKPCGKIGVPDDLEAEERTSTLVTRSLPRRCLSVEGATNNRSGMNQTARPASVFLEMDNSRRFPTSTRSRRSRNYYITRPYRREAPSPRIMSPMGFAVHRQVYQDDFDVDYNYHPTNEVQDRRSVIKPVPIWLCVFLVVSYIFGGAFLFTYWENWVFLDSAYFCFITLTTIGFGDFVPARKLNAEQGIALCSLYLLFGIALLAMSFNLVQEEVINNVKSVAKRLGIIKEQDDDENDDEEDEYAYDYDEDEEDECHELGG